MQITINRGEVAEELKNLVSIAHRTRLPITNCVHVEAHEDGQLLLAATNLEQWKSVKCAAVKVEEPGAMCVEAAMLLRLLEGDEGEATLKESGNRVEVSTAKYSAKLNTMSAQEFPPQIDLEEEQSFTVDAARLADQLAACAYAVSSDPTRAVMNGVGLLVEEDKIRLAATDGKRFSVGTLTEGTSLQVGSYILPTESIKHIKRMLGCGDEVTVRLYGSPARPTGALVRAGNATLVTKLIEGAYPNIDMVIPVLDELSSVSVKTAELRSAIDLARVFTDDTATKAINFSTADGALVIAAEHPDRGNIALPVDAEFEEDLVFNLDVNFISVALRADAGEEVELFVSDMPVVFQGVNSLHGIAKTTVT